MKTKAKHQKIIVFLALLVFFSLLTIIFQFAEEQNNVYAASNDNYLNNLSGVYSVIAYSSGGNDYGFDICGGYVSTADSNAPDLILHAIGKPAQANHRFEFHFIESQNGTSVYYITSSIDNNGRLDVKNGSFSEGNGIWFYEHNGSAAQRWIVKSCGKTVQILCADHTDFCISYNSANQLVITKNKNDSKSFWTLKSIAGDYGINTRTFVDDDNCGYRMTTEKWRYLEPLDRTGFISDVINVGVRGQGLEKTSYNGVQAFAIPYSNKFYIDTSFVYANPVYGNWTQTKQLGKSNSGGGYLPWCLSCDSYSFSSIDNKSMQVGIGLYIIEISDDNVNWKNYRLISFGSERDIDQWEIDGSVIANGVYVRMSYLFEIYAHWTVHVTDFLWWGHDEDRNEWKNIREVSDSFYVCVDGFGEKDVGVVTFKNTGNWNIEDVSVDGFSQEVRKSQTLTDGAMTFSGFKIVTAFPAYKIQVGANNGGYKTYTNGNQFTSPGKYNIKVTSKFGKTRELTLYIGEKNITKSYFGTPFANSPNETSFIKGTRILSGTDDYLNSLGLTLNYSFASVPVYQKGCSYNIKDTDLVPSLKGTIAYSGVAGDGEITINGKNQLSGVLTEPGYYTAILSTSNTVGDVVTFKLNWWVVENAPGPVINETLIKTKSQEIYDLIPVYYGVRVDNGHYRFKDELGKDVEKSQVIYYAFATYDSALKFALRVEKEYAMREGDNKFSYQNANDALIHLNEYELYQQMYKKAKENVKIRYFSNRNPLSMRIFTPYDEKGKIRKYDDGITETIAYCLDYNTNYCIVTTDKVELAALTSRQPYINNFTFISVPIDSSTVTLTDEDGTKHTIEYDKNVQEQLEAENAKSGKYVVEETNVYGDTNRYDVYYIAPDSPNKTILTISLNEETDIIVNKTKAEESYETIYETDNQSPIRSFCVKSGENSCDSHSLVLVEKTINGTDEKRHDVYDIFSLDKSKKTYTERGIYKFTVEDRMGNSYSFKIIIGLTEK